VHYNNIFKDFWTNAGYQVAYKPSCLTRPYNNNTWPIQVPEVNWTDQTVVIMHCQDFLSIHGDRCPELENIQQHFGSYSDRVIVVHWNYDLYRIYDGPLHLIYFPTHSYEIIQNLNTKYRHWIDAYDRPRTRIWQCLNGVPRPHRRVVHQWLKQLDTGIVCLSDIDPLPTHAYHDVYTWSHPDFQFCDHNEVNFMLLDWLYAETKINIVTETQYTETPGIITEKTLFALLAGQIPIIIGYPGIVEDCQRIGFDMFTDVVNISYDDDKNDHTRWRTALESNRQLLLQGLDVTPLMPRLLAQREWLLKEWPQKLINHYNQRCHEILHFLTKS